MKSPTERLNRIGSLLSPFVLSTVRFRFRFIPPNPAPPPYFAPLTYSSNTAAGTFPSSSPSENIPTLLWIWKLLALLAGCATAVLLTAHANVLVPVALSPPPLHWLQPLHTASTVQCVLLREAETVWYVAEG